MNTRLLQIAICLSIAAGSLRTAEGTDADTDAQVVLEKATTVFAEANQAALIDPARARDLYRDAALKFAYLIDEAGIRNAGLYANLANAQFQAGDLGPAILNYRRALLYAPGNGEIAESLAHARLEAVDVFSTGEGSRIWRGIFFWHYHFSQRDRLLLFGIAYCVLWALAGVMLFSKSRVFGRCIAGCGIACVLLGISMFVHQRYESRFPAGVVVESEVLARKGDGYVYEPALTNALHGGAEFHLLEKRGEWVHAVFPNQETAWLPRASVAFVEER